MGSRLLLYRFVVASLFMVVLAGCGGGGGGSSSPPPPTTQPPIVQSSSVAVNVLGVAASAVAGSVSASDPQSLPLAYSIKTTPQYGTASITSSTGAFTYTITGHTQAASDSFTVTAVSYTHLTLPTKRIV